jgi:hypothetical protein
MNFVEEGIRLESVVPTVLEKQSTFIKVISDDGQQPIDSSEIAQG